MIGFSGLGLVLLLLMKEVPMSATGDENFGLDRVDGGKDGDVQLVGLELASGSREDGLGAGGKPYDGSRH